MKSYKILFLLYFPLNNWGIKKNRDGALAGLELIKQHYDLKRNFKNKYHYILPFIIPSYLMTYKSKK